LRFGENTTGYAFAGKPVIDYLQPNVSATIQREPLNTSEMLHQNWVLPSPGRSVAEEPSALEDNRRRILGSTLFPRDSPQQPPPDPPPPPATDPGVSQAWRLRDEPSQWKATSTAPVSFPDLETDLPPVMNNFTLTFKPRPMLQNSQNYRLTVAPNYEMKRVREDLNRETDRYLRRLRQLGIM
jgi:hypothetical protein